jgi:sulfur carrier protein
MIVVLRNPRREVTVAGPRRVHALLTDLGLNRESHLVIRNGTLVPGDEVLEETDTVEIRPVISGGAS